MTLDAEKQKLFKQVRSKLGAGVRKVELTDDQLCDLLELAIGDYAQVVQNYIIQNNWSALFGKKLGVEISNNDLAQAFSVRRLDMSKDYADWYSKEVGLQQTGKFVLQKDFIKIESGKQVYRVPAGREINKVMWVTPPLTDAAIFSNMGGISVGFGGGIYGQMGFGSASTFAGIGGGLGFGAGIWALPASDIATMATDMSYKAQLFRSDLVYKVTADSDGSHLIHLLSTPGSRYTFAGGGINSFSLVGCYLWYTYYDTTGGDAEECRKNNMDVILSPDQVPLDELDYAYFNAPAKATIRQLLIAHAAETLGLIRGKFSGSINIISNTLTLDYQTFITLGQNERKEALTDLKERLQRLTPEETMKRQAEMVDNLLKVQSGTPLGIYVM